MQCCFDRLDQDRLIGNHQRNCLNSPSDKNTVILNLEQMACVHDSALEAWNSKKSVRQWSSPFRLTYLELSGCIIT